MLAGIALAMGLVMIAGANDPVWIEKHRRVAIYQLQPGASMETVFAFDAAPGDYASVTTSVDLQGLLTNTHIDDQGQVVITIFNPTSGPVSLSTVFAVRLHKM